MTVSPPPTDTDRLAEALLTARYWSAQWMPERDGVQGLAAALAPVVSQIAARHAAEELRAVAEELLGLGDTAPSKQQVHLAAWLQATADNLRTPAAALVAAHPDGQQR